LHKNIYFCFIDCAKAFDYVDHNKLWEILKEMGIADHHEKPVCRSRSNSYNWTWKGSKLEKEYDKAVYCHPAYCTYMQNTPCEMPGWIKHKLESRLLGEISTTLDMIFR